MNASEMRNLTVSENPQISSLIKEYEENMRKSAEKGNFSYTKMDELTSRCRYISDYFEKNGYKTSWDTHITHDGKYSDITIWW